MRRAGEKEISVRFDGEEIGLVPFVEDMIKETILGMMSALKGYEEGCNIEIQIKDK